MSTQTKAIPVALAILDPGPIIWAWWVLVCPYCGLAHQHGTGTIGEDPRLMLGHHNAPCQDGRGYTLLEATLEQEQALRWLALERQPYQVLGRHGELLSRHYDQADAMTALGRARVRDQWATLVNARIAGLGEVLGPAMTCGE